MFHKLGQSWERRSFALLEVRAGDDESNMTEKRTTPEDWNLMLIATSDCTPKHVLDQLSGAVLACGGWVLHMGAVSERCADIDFEFPRAYCAEIYGLLVGIGMELSQEAHAQITALCHCTQHMDEETQSMAARINLTVYARAGSEEFLGESAFVPEKAA